jgi:hypothetical protein
LKSHGGIPIEVLAAKRKKKQNDTTCNTSKNCFTILNDLDDEVLMQTAKDLEISLASDDEGCKSQIMAMKAEERLRASIAEANYKAYLEKMNLKESVHDEDILDLTVIDNSQREGLEACDSQGTHMTKTTKNLRGNKKKNK